MAMMYKAILQREYVTKTKDSKGEKTMIGSFCVLDENDTEVFSCFSAENEPLATDTPNKDKPIVARTYGLLWNFTKTGTAKKGFENVKYEDWLDRIKPAYHCRYADYGFKNIGLQLWTPKLVSFESRWIFIHRGNTGKDTAGCLLLGYGKNSNQITDSTTAIQDFYDWAKQNLDVNDSKVISNFELEVRDMQ